MRGWPLERRLGDLERLSLDLDLEQDWGVRLLLRETLRDRDRDRET